jgi:flagellar brake protein
MTQIAQLSEAEIEERFHITGRTAIQFMLIGFARERDSFSVQYNAGKELFLTTLLGVQPEKERLVFDCSGSAETNRHFLDSDHSIFVGRPGGIQVQFTTGPAVEITYEGAKAFAVALPKVLVRLQRREYFRIETPRVKPLQFFARQASGEMLNLPAHDISVSGIGVIASTLPEGLALGMEFGNCRLLLPEDAHDLFFAATVRHLTELEARSGTRHWRIGLEFKSLPISDENRIQRYIARIEHERHELS